MNRETAFLLKMAADVLDEHERSGCCSPNDPCYIVQIHQRNQERYGDGKAKCAPTQAGDETDKPGHRPSAGAKGANQFGSYKVRVASDKQVGFLRSLLATRDTSRLGELQAALVTKARSELTGEQLSKRLATDVISILVELPTKSGVPGVKMASDKQKDFVASLAADRGVEIDTNDLTAEKAGKIIEDLLKNTPPRGLRPKVASELEPGIYRNSGGIHRVYKGRTSGRMLAKLLVGSSEEGWHFEYEGAAYRFVKAIDRMSLEEAKAFGADFGTCCVCAATLTDPESIRKGIGPICEGKV